MAKLLDRKLQAVEVVAHCEKCPSGVMRFNGITLTCNPPLYPHTCNNCGHSENMLAVYPTVEYRAAP